MARLYKKPMLVAGYCSAFCPIGCGMAPPEELGLEDIRAGLQELLARFGKARATFEAVFDDGTIRGSEWQHLTQELAALEEMLDFARSLRLWTYLHRSAALPEREIRPRTLGAHSFAAAVEELRGKTRNPAVQVKDVAKEIKLSRQTTSRFLQGLGPTKLDPSQAIRLAELLGAPELKWLYCSTECRLDLRPPRIENRSIDQITSRLYQSYLHLQELQQEVADTLADGKVEDSEENELNRMLTWLQGVVFSVDSLAEWTRSRLLEQLAVLEEDGAISPEEQSRYDAIRICLKALETGSEAAG
jgi:transcriptional regulator with XRE-family HTH domain